MKQSQQRVIPRGGLTINYLFKEILSIQPQKKENERKVKMKLIVNIFRKKKKTYLKIKIEEIKTLEYFQISRINLRILFLFPIFTDSILFINKYNR